jgi:maltose O-acetyltransferase
VKLLRVLAEELGFGSVSVRLSLANTLLAGCHKDAFGRVRSSVYRACGLQIGPQTMLYGRLPLRSSKRAVQHLKIGARCVIYEPASIDCADSVTIGDQVTLGPGVSLITATHEMHCAAMRAGALQTAPIVIGDGVWLCLGVIVLPGVTIGAGSVIAAGSVVTKDVPENSLFGGIPARRIRTIGPEHAE